MGRIGVMARSSSEITEDLLKAGVSVFGQKGFEAATLSEIARMCGVTTGAVYARWPNKREVFVAVLEYVAPKRIATLTGDLPPHLQFARLWGSLLHAGTDLYRNLFFEACTTARRDEDLKIVASRIFEAEAETIAAMVSELKDTEILDKSVSTASFVLMARALEFGSFLVTSTASTQQHIPTQDEWNRFQLLLFSALTPPPPD